MGKNLTTEIFVKKAKNIHKNKYDYSRVKYLDSKTKISIVCLQHGEFFQRPNDHLQGKGCILCAGTNKKTNEKFIEQAIEIHGEKYDYSKVNYFGNRTKIKIICPTHGIFEQIPYDHLKGLGCAKCSKIERLTNEEFIKRAIELHGEVYDYSSVSYKNMHTKVKINCKKHGQFIQTPHNHIKLAGCPKCNKSKGEKIISWFLIKESICYEEQKKFDDCKNKTYLPFDFYLPEYNFCIEFQGIQHFESNGHMGGNKGLEKRKINDKIKKEFCQKNNIKLIEIKYSDNIISILKNELNLN